MKKSKLIQLIKVFTINEIKRLEQFVQSPYHNKDEQVNLLFKILKENYPFSESKQIEKEVVFKKIFPKSPYNDQKMRNYMARLLKLTEDFITVENLKKNQDLYNRQLLVFYREKELYRLYESHFKSSKKNLQKTTARNADFYSKSYGLADEYNNYIEKTFVRTEENFGESIYLLDIFYLIEKLQFSCNIINHQNIMQGDNKVWLMDVLIDKLEGSEWLKIPSINIYYHILKMLTEKTESEHYFKDLKILLEKEKDLFEADELRDMYFFGMNYCTRQINNGKREYLREIFDLYKKTIETKIIFQGNYVSPWNYKNIVTVALLLEEFEWVKRFIYDYKKYLSQEYKENAFTYNLARYYFYAKNYKKAMSLLQEVEYQDVFYTLDSKSILLKTYYELEEIDAIYSLIDSFRKFLHRNKLISAIQRKNYLNMVRFINRLLNIHPRDYKKLQHLRQQIIETDQVADKKWLLSKIPKL